MKNIVISTGAGISAESGIHTYRDKDGLWTKFDPMEVSHIRGWQKSPEKVLEFKNMLRRQFAVGNYQPNAAHHAIARLQREWKHGTVTLITQNIDGLHRAAGSAVLEIHGNGQTKFCTACGHESPYDADIVLDDPCQSCGKTRTTRPYVVMFGEMPCHLEYVQDRLDDCQIMAVIGSSLEVAPGNLFANLAYAMGATTYLINKDEPACGLEDFTHVIYGSAATEVPLWVEKLLRDNP